MRKSKTNANSTPSQPNDWTRPEEAGMHVSRQADKQTNNKTIMTINEQPIRLIHDVNVSVINDMGKIVD